MSAIPIRRRRLITMPGDDARQLVTKNKASAQVIHLGIARQRIRGVKASRHMNYHDDPPA